MTENTKRHKAKVRKSINSLRKTLFRHYDMLIDSVETCWLEDIDCPFCDVTSRNYLRLAQDCSTQTWYYMLTRKPRDIIRVDNKENKLRLSDTQFLEEICANKPNRARPIYEQAIPEAVCRKIAILTNLNSPAVVFTPLNRPGYTGGTKIDLSPKEKQRKSA